MFQYYSFPYPGHSPAVPAPDTPPPPGGRCRPCTPATIQSVGGTALHECRVCGAAWRRNASCEFVRDPSADAPPPAPAPPPRDATEWSSHSFYDEQSPFSVAEIEEIRDLHAKFPRNSVVYFVRQDGTWQIDRAQQTYRRVP